MAKSNEQLAAKVLVYESFRTAIVSVKVKVRNDLVAKCLHSHSKSFLKSAKPKMIQEVYQSALTP